MWSSIVSISWQQIVIRFAKPIVVFLGKLYFRFEKPKIKGIHYYRWRDSIYPGDILLSSSNGEVGSNLINPSEIKHGGIYLGKCLHDDVCYVSEALGEGVILTDLVTFLTSKDRIIVLRPKFNFDIHGVTTSAMSRVGYEYDYEFESNDDQYYCFEHIALSYIDQNGALQFKKSETLGYEYYSSDSFLKDDKLFEKIIDSKDIIC